jgi:hypothetical protein
MVEEKNFSEYNIFKAWILGQNILIAQYFEIDE